MSLQTLPIETLQSGEYQPRKQMTQAPLQELAESIRVEGIIQPIVVRQLNNLKYEIIAGERRWRAAQLAGLTDVPVVIKVMNDRSAIAVAIIENVQREDLNALEESNALRRLQEEFSLTHQEIADAIGKSRTTVTNLLRLNDLELTVKDALVAGDISMGHARALLSLTPQQQVAAAKKIIKSALSVRSTEKLVQVLQSRGEENTVKSKLDQDILALQTAITDFLGANVVIKHRKNNAGEICIHYNSLDEFDGIIANLGLSAVYES